MMNKLKDIKGGIRVLIQYLNINTLFFNFKYLPFSQAILLPVYISRKTHLKCVKGRIQIKSRLQPGMIRIGYGDVGIFDKHRSRTIWGVKGTVVFEGTAKIGHGARISVSSNSILSLGDNFILNAESAIVCQKGISFGQNCLLSWDILIMDTDLHKIYDLDGNVSNYPVPVVVGNNVWIGCRSLILKGADIADGCIVAANTTVSKKFHKTNMIVGGTPAAERRQIKSWDHEGFSKF
ncbi:DapH/DapD/GlmU-related protein [Mucilaginibacter sp. KACC 22773]|uniref:acyltransferase n=1 Tax=Mucilaginibacter sp. KACC 22773 TaxID=3025671 RepID=UPI002366C2BE|nr:DapH/DapD/GlmU-related protein [Mucilaginibacter sp. KACC 22773]WDF79151.1 DapH/DapD/GlmU-related protein [Mucilaginibacter sp. KACC 22773]